MAHFAKLGINGKVIQVIPFDNNRMLNADGIEDEEVGRQSLEQETGWPLWKQCSFNTHKGLHDIEGKTPLRANYPAIGDIYSEQHNIFYIPREKGFESWTLNTTTGAYEPPIAMPNYDISKYEIDGVTYKYCLNWNESTQKWEGYNNNRTTKLAIWNGASWDTV